MKQAPVLLFQTIARALEYLIVIGQSRDLVVSHSIAVY